MKTIEDILSFYPFRYEERELKDYRSWQQDENIIIQGRIISKPKYFRYRSNQALISFKLEAQDNLFSVSAFNQPWIAKYDMTKEVVVLGKYEGHNRILATTVNLNPIEEQIGIIPVYSLKNKITPKNFSAIMKQALEANMDLPDFLPSSLVREKSLLSRFEALMNIHFPEDKSMLKKAINTLKWEEFLKFHLAMALRHDENHQENEKYRKKFDVSRVYGFISSLPFTLTDDQKAAVDEILADLAAPRQMSRLLQGDVGCGKTIVAFIAMYATVLSGKQAALMAPTEFLARQHYDNFRRYFDDLGVRSALLVSSTPAAEKKQILADISSGEIQAVIGTHALFQEKVSFADLGLMITDEQHRFGVRQRAMLQGKGENGDVLLMSATPIPRTLAATLYADLDVTSIQQMPNSHKKIHTSLIKRNGFYDIKDEIEQLLSEGNQMYVICAAIENDNELAVRNVNDVFDSLRAYFNDRYSIGLLHSKMDEEIKQNVQQRFADGQIDILVSTTVVEVGVDVKKANIMIIYDANRFGLSQLHQLRGRVGRGDREGHCYLLTSAKDPQTLDKLQIIVDNDDGFQIASYDLQMRGPGDLLGVRQSGLPNFILGNIVTDTDIINESRRYALSLLKSEHLDPQSEIAKYISSISEEAAVYTD